jgi:hypothetical protein
MLNKSTIPASLLKPSYGDTAPGDLSAERELLDVSCAVKHL